jgi:high-affinity iron transporter
LESYILPSFLLSIREGLEAALILGIVLGVLRQVQRRELVPVVWIGAGAAALLSLVAALGLNYLGLTLEGTAEQVFEGITMLLAAGVLTWMIFWMARQARSLKADLVSGVRQASRGGQWSLFGLSFLAVLREGVELALFLTATALTGGAQATLFGALLGLGAAALLGVLIFATSLRLDMQPFFRVTGFMLLLFSAGLVAHGVHEFNEAGWIPAIIEHVWNLNPFLDDSSTLGTFLKTLFGYNADPSLTEVLAYGVYLGAVLLGLRLDGRRRQLGTAEGAA